MSHLLAAVVNFFGVELQLIQPHYLKVAILIPCYLPFFFDEKIIETQSKF